MAGGLTGDLGIPCGEGARHGALAEKPVMSLILSKLRVPASQIVGIDASIHERIEQDVQRPRWPLPAAFPPGPCFLAELQEI